MADTNGLIRICVALTERTSKHYEGDGRGRRDWHPVQKHHWNLLIEYAPESRLWHQYHTLEKSAWQRTQHEEGCPEEFEDLPVKTLAKDPRSKIHVASVPVEQRKLLITMLEERLVGFVKRQQRCKETCRFFVEQTLVWLHGGTAAEVLDITFPEKVEDKWADLKKYSGVPEIGNIFRPKLLRQQIKEKDSTSTMPEATTPQLRSKKSFWRKKVSDKENSGTSSRSESVSETKSKSKSKSRGKAGVSPPPAPPPQQQRSISISKPRPVPPEELAKVIQQQRDRQYPSRESDRENRQRIGEKDSSSGLFRSMRQREPRDSSKEAVPPRRVSENPTPSMRMLGALDPRGLRNRNSSPR